MVIYVSVYTFTAWVYEGKQAAFEFLSLACFTLAIIFINGRAFTP
jgi:hypothetical protein